MPSDEIKTVRRIHKDGWGYVTKCPHCSYWVGVEGDDASEIRGEQYECRCGGIMEIDYDARYAGEVPDE